MNEKLSISGEQFEEFRTCFDALLNNLVATMVNYGSEEGSINVKLDVGLQEEEVNGVKVRKPTFKHSTSTVVQVKQKISGSICGEYNVVFDEAIGSYVIKDIDNGQVSFTDAPQDDYDYEEPD